MTPMIPRPASPLHPGDRVAGYEVLARIGGGGYGTAYRVLNTNLRREECLKITHRHTGVDLDEARMIAGLGLDGVAAVHASGIHDGRAWYTMILADHGDLHHYLRRLPGSPSDDARLRLVIDLIGQVAGTLDRLAGLPSPVTHGDIKPRNILVHAGTGSPRALLADFGLARATAAEPGGSDARWTRAGTPEYIAPEMWMGTTPATPATDRYALACTAFAAITGRTAFDVGDSGDRADRLNRARLAQLNPDRPVPGRIDPALSRFDPVFRRALALDPTNRYPTAAAFHAALVAALEKPARRRRRILTGAIAGTGVAILAAAAVLVVPTLTANRPTPGSGGTAVNAAIPEGICPPMAVTSNLRAASGDGTFFAGPMASEYSAISATPDVEALFRAIEPACLLRGPEAGLLDSGPRAADPDDRATFIAVFDSDDPSVLDTRDRLLALVAADGRQGDPSTWRGLDVRLTESNTRITEDGPTGVCVLDDPDRPFTVVELHVGSEGRVSSRGDGKPASAEMCDPATRLIEDWNRYYDTGSGAAPTT